jgi:AcrR family transcriptional regulator
MPRPAAVRERERAAHLGPERRRPDVLDAALQLIAEAGVDAVTMGALAERLEVTRPVVYACYPGRGAVLSALLLREQQRLLAEVVRALPAEPSIADPKLLLRESLRALLNTAAAQAESWRALFAASGNAAVADSYAASRAQVAEQLLPLLAAALRRGDARVPERKLRVLADYVIAVGERAIRTVLDDDAGHSPEQLAELTADFLAAALAGA